MRFLRFLRSTLSLKTSDRGRWLHQVNATHAQSKSSSKLLSAPLNGITELFDQPLLLLWGEILLSENRVHAQPPHAQLRKKRIKSKKEPVWRSSTGTSGLPR
jgi:hypothetical protein